MKIEIELNKRISNTQIHALEAIRVYSAITLAGYSIKHSRITQ